MSGTFSAAGVAAAAAGSPAAFGASAAPAPSSTVNDLTDLDLVARLYVDPPVPQYWLIRSIAVG